METIYTITSDALKSHRVAGFSASPVETTDPVTALTLAQQWIELGLRGVKVLVNGIEAPLNRLPGTWGVSA